jgi:hypothetical protein
MAAHASIGSVTQQTGATAEIRRGSNSITSQQNTAIESMDTVVVGSRAETDITFRDNTRVKIKENSRLVIDNFVFDPNRSDASRMAVRVTLGTVQYTSGQIARTNRQNLNIATPTATIAVRGTDMAMSVDEVGRSFVVLLPSCSDPREINRFEIAGNCTVGIIDVTTSAGTVTLTQPFTATYVTSANQQPLPPVRIEANIATISNDLALRKPESIMAAEQQRNETRERARSAVIGGGEASGNNNTARAAHVPAEQVTRTNAMASSLLETSLTASTSQTTLQVQESSSEETAAGNCWPFNACGNERGRNWYHREDPQRNNVIKILSADRSDNTTYNISINEAETQTRVVGNGSSTVTIRIWNR